MSGERTSGLRLTPQAIVAIIIILFGLLKTADNLGWVEAAAFLRLWPLALVAVGVVMFLRAADRPGRFSGGLVTLLGLWLSGGRIFGWHVSIAALWPLLLVALGVSMILRTRSTQRDGADSRLSDLAFWSGVKRRISSPSFRRADLTAVMGGIEMDLRAAATGGGEAVLDLFVVMGGVEITVPPDWAVTNQVLAIMGGVDDKSTGTQTSTNRLLLRGFVMMGGVEIKT